MSSLKTKDLAITKDGIAVYGYIRENFDKKCWIDEIISTIVKFYMIKGGSLYMCGYGGNGRLGIEKYKNNTCKIPTLCRPFTNNNALKVSASEYHTLILDTEGDVWCCGWGYYGQLGDGEDNDLYVPTKMILGVRVIAISAGGEHSLLLCEDGTVKGCGRNNKGQIGLGYFKKTLIPKTIRKLKKCKVIQICAGEYHSAALTEDGYLFCFGENIYGQCGVEKKKEKKIRAPTKVDLDDEIEFVECGNIHTLVITRKGLFYSFGNGSYGRLGHGDWDDEYVPKLNEELKEKRITMCGAGRYHSLCIDEEGIIWSFGDNHSGQCGLSEDIKVQTTPKMIEWFIERKIRAKECSAGWRASSVIASDGSLYLFGRNDYYQLGLNEDKRHRTPTKLSISQNVEVQGISMGKFHTAIICND